MDSHRIQSKFARQLFGRGLRLADDGVGAPVGSDKNGPPNGPTLGCYPRPNCTALADNHSGSYWNKKAQEEYKRGQVRHCGKNQMGTYLPHEYEQPREGIARALCAEAVKMDCFREFQIGRPGLSEQRQMHFVFTGIEVTGKSGNDLLSSAGSEMWDEQKNSNSRCRFGTHAIVE
jgi:hypothetical protein